VAKIKVFDPATGLEEIDLAKAPTIGPVSPRIAPTAPGKQSKPRPADLRQLSSPNQDDFGIPPDGSGKRLDDQARNQRYLQENSGVARLPAVGELGAGNIIPDKSFGDIYSQLGGLGGLSDATGGSSISSSSGGGAPVGQWSPDTQRISNLTSQRVEDMFGVNPFGQEGLNVRTDDQAVQMQQELANLKSQANAEGWGGTRQELGREAEIRAKYGTLGAQTRTQYTELQSRYNQQMVQLGQAESGRLSQMDMFNRQQAMQRASLASSNAARASADKFRSLGMLIDLNKFDAQRSDQNFWNNKNLELSEKGLEFGREVGLAQGQAAVNASQPTGPTAGGVISGAGQGAISGAVVGSIVPGIGTAVGGIIGGALGFLGGLFS